MINFSKVKDPEAKDFLQSFFAHREINQEFYRRVPEDKFDFRMVDKPQRKSDSPRESLAHQINVQKTYMKAIESGELRFGDYYQQRLKAKSKNELLQELERADKELVDLLVQDEILKKKIVVPWNKKRVTVVQMLWGLQEHEILHTGWNLAIMDHLNIKRFPALKRMWG